MNFLNKRILVTGGTRGIGRGIVEAFLRAQARVAINGSTAETTAKATPQEVLRIVYLTDKDGVDSGGFYPNGMNGKIKST